MLCKSLKNIISCKGLRKINVHNLKNELNSASAMKWTHVV